MKTVAGKYNRVGDKKGALLIGGAVKKMEEDPTFMYVPHYHVAGPKKDIEAWLTENHPEKVKEVMKSSYSMTTLKSKSVREAFEQEIDNATEARASTNSTKAEMRQVNLMVLVKLLKLYQEQKKADPSSVTTAKSNNDLKDKVASLEDDKVLDITNMKRKGTDAKKMAFKEGSNRRRLSQQEGDPFYRVVYNPKSKSSVDGVKHFLTLYGSFDKEKISQISEAVSEGSVVNINKAKSPTRSPLLSPSRRSRRGGRRTEVDDVLDEL